jgi:hypothetical protein
MMSMRAMEQVGMSIADNITLNHLQMQELKVTHATG